jgi:DNA-binding NarL/FixJ family response regulator
MALPLGKKTVLTEKEKKVVSLVSDGWKNKEIAKQIGTSEHVVKNILRGIYDKTGMWNRLELALWVVKGGGVSK